MSVLENVPESVRRKTVIQHVASLLSIGWPVMLQNVCSVLSGLLTIWLIGKSSDAKVDRRKLTLA